MNIIRIQAKSVAFTDTQINCENEFLFFRFLKRRTIFSKKNHFRSSILLLPLVAAHIEIIGKVKIIAHFKQLLTLNCYYVIMLSLILCYPKHCHFVFGFFVVVLSTFLSHIQRLRHWKELKVLWFGLGWIGFI